MTGDGVRCSLFYEHSCISLKSKRDIWPWLQEARSAKTRNSEYLPSSKELFNENIGDELGTGPDPSSMGDVIITL